AFLKTQHGESAEAPRKITLKRKTTTTIKTGTGSARKTVNVEVRKKRTYVKRTDLEGDAGGDQDLLQDAEELLEIDNEQATFEAVEAEVPAPVAEIAAPEVSEEAPQATEAEAAPAQPRVFVDDAENRRQAAILARQNATKEADALARKAAEERRKKDEAKKLVTKKPTAAPVLSAEELAAKAEEEKHKLSKKKERTIEIPIEEEEDSRNRHNKKAGKAVKKTAVVAPKKGSAVLTYLDEDNEFGGPRGHRKGGRKLANKHGFKKPTSKIVHEVEIPESITVSELASRMSVKGTEVVKHLMKMGVMASLNQVVDQDTAHIVVADFGHQAVLVSHDAVEHNFQRTIDEQDGEYVTRAPIITVMGHVDHGKTSLLDYIRKAKVAAGEAGGITQHIGAYRVPTSHGELTFLDTPGHAAFTAMRARGARCTDVVILVVAADDGVMPQTEEAIKHAKAAGVPMVVAINKCDKPSADPDRVKNELVVKDVIPDDWGGDTQFVQVSALTGDGVDQLLEAVAIQAELLELNAQINVPGRGVVIESRMDKGRGVVATLLVQNGELKTGDMVLAGQSFGRVRAMVDEHSAQIKAAGPSMPVEILGLDVAPNAGDEFAVVSDERKAREVSEFRAVKEREERMARTQVSKLENMFANIAAGEKKTLSVVVKTDVRGSLEAINAALLELGNSEVEVRIVGDGVGGITENDINLAMTTRAIVVGFNVRADGSARKLAEREGVDIRYYSIIYQLIDEVKAALSGMLDPERVETILGIAQVRDTFRSPKFGQVAGCMVLEGTVYRNKRIRVLRDNVVIFEGELESLRRFKDDVAEVRHGMECGIGVKNYEVKVGDQIEVYEVKEVARSL
ncbi:MAG TPA: translation initiation factor IF-2, partial [Cellvibrionaceae bacterium]|nr:translation initiation factor IF-2 [Cellvibrionaceae bacterium]